MEEPLGLGWEGRQASAGSPGLQAPRAEVSGLLAAARSQLCGNGGLGCPHKDVPEGGRGGQLLREAEAIPGCLLPGWELALGPLLRVHPIP